MGVFVRSKIAHTHAREAGRLPDPHRPIFGIPRKRGKDCNRLRRIASPVFGGKMWENAGSFGYFRGTCRQIRNAKVEGSNPFRSILRPSFPGDGHFCASRRFAAATGRQRVRLNVKPDVD